MAHRKKEKPIWKQVRGTMPPPSKIIQPKKGKGAYNRQKEKTYAKDAYNPHDRTPVAGILTFALFSV